MAARGLPRVCVRIADICTPSYLNKTNEVQSETKLFCRKKLPITLSTRIATRKSKKSARVEEVNDRSKIVNKSGNKYN